MDGAVHIPPPPAKLSETKILYQFSADFSDTPYLMKLPISPDEITLGHFKHVLNVVNHKFYFRSVDDDFGFVKEEISDNAHHLPHQNGKVYAFIEQPKDPPPTSERLGGIGDSAPPSFHAGSRNPYYQSSTFSSELETSSFSYSDDDSLERTESAWSKRRRRRRPTYPPSKASQPQQRRYAYSTTTSSSLTPNVIKVLCCVRDKTQPNAKMQNVTLPHEHRVKNGLGVSVVGQSSMQGEVGIYIGSIMKGGAVSQTGLIEPGDMILAVNNTSFENLSNDTAVRILQDAAKKPGPLQLVVAKCWESVPRSYANVSRQEPVQPIDPSAWIAHQAALHAFPSNGLSPPSVSLTNSTSMISSGAVPELIRFEDLRLSVTSDLSLVVQAMKLNDSGLEIRDRSWLKMAMPNAFLGKDLVDWLFKNVEGFGDRKYARKYAGSMLKMGYIQDLMNSSNFSEPSYYSFGPRAIHLSELNSLRVADDSSYSADPERDTLTPLPPQSSSWKYNQFNTMATSTVASIGPETDHNHNEDALDNDLQVSPLPESPLANSSPVA